MCEQEKVVKLSRSEAREQAFMLLFSRSFVQEPIEDTFADAEQLFEGISRTSLSILRLAVYEIKYLDSIPDSVSVNEAVELAKKYTIDESGFVNGILGSFIRSRAEEKQ